MVLILMIIRFKRSFLNMLRWLAGYRKHSFKLSNGKRFVCWTKSRQRALQLALDREQQIRKERDLIIKLLTSKTEIGRHPQEIPDELIHNVLSA